MNLIVNASDAMHASPESARTLSIHTARVGDSVQVDVSDRGPGIKPDELERVFDMFFTTKTGGMGIGLAICRSIIAAHGGTLTAMNVPGGGAMLRVVLPVQGA